MIIYIAENTINGKKYVGRTIQTLDKRKKAHISESKRSNYYFHNALQKYGIKNFKWYVIDKAKNENELIDKEDYYIKIYGDYNIGSSADGGDNISNNPRKEFIDWNSKARKEHRKVYWNNKENRIKQSEIAKKQMTSEKNELMQEGWRKKLQDETFLNKYKEKQRKSGAWSPDIIEKRSNSKAMIWKIWKNDEIFTIKNLNKFCKENDLNVSAMHMVSSGKRNHHKGWKCVKYGS